MGKATIYRDSFWLWMISCGILLGCATSSQSKVSSIQDLLIQAVEFPLRLTEVNLKNKSGLIAVSDQKEVVIRNTIRDFYFKECGGDSAETYFKIKDTYIGTIQLQDSRNEIYVVLLHHLPDGVLNSKVLFYDKNSHEFLAVPFDFNLHATYDFHHGRFHQINLVKQSPGLKPPDIVSVDINGDGINEYRFTRYLHNGTANGLETALLQVTASGLDTLSLEQNWFNE